MINLRQSRISASVTDVGGRTRKKTDMEILRKNPKVDSQLLLEFYRLIEEYGRLIAPLKGIIQIKQGADYNLAHPLARKDMPTDAYHRGIRVGATMRP